MTEPPRDPDDAETPAGDARGLETGSAPQPLDFPGADQEPPGRPDGDSEPGDGGSEPGDQAPGDGDSEPGEPVD